MLSTTTTLNSSAMNLKTLALCTALLTSPAWAQMEYKVYKAEKANPRMIAYVSGINRGAEWTNTAAEVETGKKVFCQPSGYSSNVTMAMGMIDAHAEGLSEAERSRTPIEMMLIKGLIATFPCPSPATR